MRVCLLRDGWILGETVRLLERRYEGDTKEVRKAA